MVRRWCSSVFRFKLFVSKISKVCIYNFLCALSAHVSSLLWTVNGSERKITLRRSWRWTIMAVSVRVFPIIYLLQFSDFFRVGCLRLQRRCIGDAQIVHLNR